MKTGVARPFATQGGTGKTSHKVNISYVQSETASLGDLRAQTVSTARIGSTAAYSRLYHSTALLLPDGTVLSMGSNPGGRGSYEPAIEIYTPSYLYDANDHLITTNRPQITGLSFPGPFHYGTPFSVSYTSTSPISSAVLVRPGSSTHASNMEQRLIVLCGGNSPCSPSGNPLVLTTPANGTKHLRVITCCS